MSATTTGATGLAGRYATALFALADGEHKLDEVAQDLGRLKALIDESADLGRVVRSPVLTRAEQGRAMAAVMERAGIGDLSRRFVGVAAANRRLYALSAMIAAYRALLARRRGEAAAEVTTAAALTPAQRDAVAEALRRTLGTKVAVDARVDPRLLGGIVVKVGSRMVDGSLSTKLQRMRLAMKGIG